MEYKALPQFTKEIEDRTVVGIFAVHGNVDEGFDRSWPGSFMNTAVKGRNRARFVWQHRTDEPPTAVIKAIREVSRAELPASVLDYAPEATGGVEVAREYLDTPRGNEILTGLKAGAIEEMSYSYDVVRYDFEEVDGRKIRNIREVKLYDVSDVLWGMNPATVGIKGWSGTDLPFVAHSEAVVSTVEEFVRRVKDRQDFRAKEGRMLSEANRKRISSLLESLQAVAGDLQTLLDEATPKAKADPTEVQRLYARFLRTEAHLNGVLTQ